MNWNWIFRAVWMLCLGVNDMRREMKDSGVEWIGEIPEDWKVEKLQWHLQEINKSNNPVETEYILSLNNKTGVIPYEERDNMGNKAKEDYSQYKIAYPDTLVMNSMNVIIGSVGISHYYGCISPVYYVFKASDKTELRYINYVFKIERFQKNLRKYANGILEIRLRISVHDTLRRLIPIPSYEEQCKIANFLDGQCEKLDSVIEKTKASIVEYQKLKQSIITHACMNGLENGRKMKNSEVTWLGNIPEEWHVYRIANLYQERSESGLEDLPILTVSINTGVSDREIADEEKNRVFVRSEDRTKYKRVYPGDLVYNMMRAWQGAFGAVRVEGMVSPAYVVAKPKDGIEIDSRYMEALLRTSEATEEMHRYSRGIVDFRLRLYWPEFKNIRICLPPIEEQREIADYIDRKNEEIDRLIKKKEQFISELENYKKSLIYEYVTGKKEVSES